MTNSSHTRVWCTFEAHCEVIMSPTGPRRLSDQSNHPNRVTVIGPAGSMDVDKERKPKSKRYLWTLITKVDIITIASNSSHGYIPFAEMNSVVLGSLI